MVTKATRRSMVVDLIGIRSVHMVHQKCGINSRLNVVMPTQ